MRVLALLSLVAQVSGTLNPDVSIEPRIVALGGSVEGGSEKGSVVRGTSARGLVGLQFFMFVRVRPHVSQLDNS